MKNILLIDIILAVVISVVACIGATALFKNIDHKPAKAPSSVQEDYAEEQSLEELLSLYR